MSPRTEAKLSNNKQQYLSPSLSSLLMALADSLQLSSRTRRKPTEAEAVVAGAATAPADASCSSRARTRSRRARFPAASVPPNMRAKPPAQLPCMPPSRPADLSTVKTESGHGRYSRLKRSEVACRCRHGRHRRGPARARVRPGGRGRPRPQRTRGPRAAPPRHEF